MDEREAANWKCEWIVKCSDFCCVKRTCLPVAAHVDGGSKFIRCIFICCCDGQMLDSQLKL